jgi:hypothetical protein
VAPLFEPYSGRRRVRENPELLNGVDRCTYTEAAVHPVHIAGAVEQIVVRLGPLPVHGKSLRGFDRAARGSQAVRQRYDTGLQQAELSEVPAIERQVHDLLLRDGLTQTA